MVTLESEIDRIRGVTYVRTTVTNTRSTPQMVTLESCLDGPTWLPRDASGSVKACTAGVWKLPIGSECIRGIGFASPAPPASPPVAISSTSRIDDWATRPADVLSRLDPASTRRSQIAFDP